MIELDMVELQGWLARYAWPFLRIGAFMMAAPIIGTQLVPARIRLMLALMATLAIAPAGAPIPLTLSAQVVVLALQQMLIGFGLAFFLQMLLHMFVMAGQMMAMKMGLGFASLVDPANGVTVTVVSQFYLMLVTLLFLAVDGHLAMLEVLAESFWQLPVGTTLPTAGFYELAQLGSWLFGGALLMAMPAVTALLIVNCCLGVVTRAAPQLNIFVIGFPMMMVLGLLIVWASLSGLLPQFNQFTGEALAAMRDWGQA